MVHIIDYLGVEYIVNKANVNFIERLSKGEEGYANCNDVKGTGKGSQPAGKKRNIHK